MTHAPVKATKADLVRQHLEAMIDAGLEPHAKLPTERDLSEQMDVSRLTVRRALDQLENEGVIYRVQGAGTFVSERTIAKSIELTSFSEDMRARGLRPGSQSIRGEETPAGPRVAHALGISPSEMVIHLERVRTADDSPMCLEHSYIPASLAPDLIDSVGHESLYHLLEERFSVRIESAQQTIRATVLDPGVSSVLGTAPFTPAFHVTRIAFDGRGRAVEYAESVYRGDRYSYELAIQRRHHPRDQ